MRNSYLAIPFLTIIGVNQVNASVIEATAVGGSEAFAPFSAVPMLKEVDALIEWAQNHQ